MLPNLDFASFKEKLKTKIKKYKQMTTFASYCDCIQCMQQVFKL